METDFSMRQAMETKRWKDVRLSIFYATNRDSDKAWSGDLKQKIEGHMTLYLDSKYQDSGSEVRNQKMECHTTFHLERKFKLI
jgi:hypothetical protein